MRFADYITVPAGTTFNDPETKTIKLSAGTITQTMILFPAGSNGLVHLAIDHYGHQLYPTNPNGSFVGDDQAFSIDDAYPIDEAPFSITLRAWAPNATLDHTIYVAFTLSALEPDRPSAPVSVAAPEEAIA